MNDNIISLMIKAFMEMSLMRVFALSCIVVIPIIAWRLPEIIKVYLESRRKGGEDV